MAQRIQGCLRQDDLLARLGGDQFAIVVSPADAAALGWALGPLRPDWERVREDVMLAALRAKFTQHPALLAELVATGARPLADHTATDAYWGDGGDGTGRTRLGELLMRVRGELR